MQAGGWECRTTLNTGGCMFGFALVAIFFAVLGYLAVTNPIGEA